MAELFIENAWTRASYVTPEGKREGVRLYRQSPFNANLQIWSKTERRAVISNCALNADECRELARELLAIADELKSADELKAYLEG